MPTYTIESVTTPMTRAQVQAKIYELLAQIGVSTTTWKPGAVVRTIVSVLSVILAAFTSLAAAIAKSGFLETADDNWAELVAYYVFGVSRTLATYATGEVTVDNTGGGVYSFDPGDLIVRNPSTGKTYRNTAAVAIGALETGVAVAIEAIEAGSASTSAPDTITAFETSYAGLEVTNALAVVGQDDETIPALKIRCYEKLDALSPNGPREAYSYFAKTAAREDGSLVGVTRVRVSAPASTAAVTVTVATNTGAVSGSSGDPATDLGAVNSSIQRNAVPLGITATVQTATALPIPVTYSVWAYTSGSLTTDELKAAIEAALLAAVQSIPIGGHVIPPAVSGYVYADALVSTIEGARAEIFHATVSGGDQAVTSVQVPVLGTITATVHWVEP